MSFRKSSKNSNPPIEVHVTRGNLTESVHLVDACVVDMEGAEVALYGNSDQVLTYPRSSVKMIQALCLVESGAFHAFDLSEKHLALACASHHGEVVHTDLVLQWLNQIGCQEEDLICGPHFPYDEQTSRDMIRRGLDPHRRHNNCSGKHCGFLTVLKHFNWNMKGYGAFDHPLQIKLRQILQDLSGDRLADSPWGIDGCGIPTYAMSLTGLARSMRHFLRDETLPPDRKEALRLIRRSVLRQPYYIGGKGDFGSELMHSFPERLMVKSGAEGVYAGTLLNEGLAVSLKVRDGNPRASRVAMAALLRHFNGLTEPEFLQLSDHTQPAVKNWSGDTVGKIFVPHPLMG